MYAAMWPSASMSAASGAPLTHDAAYKFALWRRVWAQSRRDAHDAGVSDATVADAVATATAADASVATSAALLLVERRVADVALTAVRRHLPRRVYAPCCLAGECTPHTRAPHHARVHLGRRDVVAMADVLRDDACHCLAHAMAPLETPVQLRIGAYTASSRERRDAHAGLRCLLRHVPLQRVAVHDVGSPHDAHELVVQLTRLYDYTRWQYDATRLCTHVCLVDVAVSSSDVAALLRGLLRADVVTHLTLQRCQALQTLDGVAAYVHASRALTHLSLRDNAQATHWEALARAAAHSATVVHVDVASCAWDKLQLSHFLTAFAAMTPRDEFALDVSHNMAALTCCAPWLQHAPRALCEQLTSVCLDGLCMREADGELGQLVAMLPRLCRIDVGHGVLGDVCAQRFVRALADARRCWRRVSLAATSCSSLVLRRVVQLCYADEATLVLARLPPLQGQVTTRVWASCMRALASLDLSYCALTDDDVVQLSSTVERCAPVPLRQLRLDGNAFGQGKRGGEGGVPMLCKALRSACMPHIGVVSLSHNRLSLRAAVALVEQVSSTLQQLCVSHTTAADDARERAALVDAVMRRQLGRQPIALLDVWCVSALHDDLALTRASERWLAQQTAIRVLVCAE